MLEWNNNRISPRPTESTPRMTKLVTFGETMVSYNAKYLGPFDPNTDGPYEVYCAGAESNVCLDLQRLAVPGLETVWVSKLGMDDEGDAILRSLDGRTTVVAPQVRENPSGIAYVNHMQDGSIVKSYRRKGSAASTVTFDDVRPHLADADVLHVTGITPALSPTTHDAIFQTIEYAHDNNVPVTFDVNYRPPIWEPSDARPVFDEMLPYSSVFKVGHDEAETVWGWGLSAEEYARRFQRINARLVIVTRDADGAIAYDGTNLVEHPGYSIDFVDPVGAGDAFIAGFLAEVFRQGTVKSFLAASDHERRKILERSLAVANVCGALICTRRGDTEAMPTAQEVAAFLESNSQSDSTP